MGGRTCLLAWCLACCSCAASGRETFASEFVDTARGVSDAAADEESLVGGDRPPAPPADAGTEAQQPAASGDDEDALPEDPCAPGSANIDPCACGGTDSEECAGPPPEDGCRFLAWAGSSYWVCSEPRTQQFARVRCRTAGMELVAVEDAAENAALALEVGAAGAWLGLSDRRIDRWFEWTDGRPLEQHFFAEPPTGSEDCVLLLPGGQWQASDCELQRGYVCQSPPDCSATEERCNGVDDDCNGIADDADTCPEGCVGVAWADQAYSLCADDEAWHDAAQVCARMNGALAEVSSEAENERLRRFANAVGERDLWLGGTDQAVESEWRWPGGDTFWAGGPGDASGAVAGRFAGWDSREPNDHGDQDCLAMRASGAWDDDDCDDGYAFLCEIP